MTNRTRLQNARTFPRLSVLTQVMPDLAKALALRMLAKRLRATGISEVDIVTTSIKNKGGWIDTYRNSGWVRVGVYIVTAPDPTHRTLKHPLMRRSKGWDTFYCKQKSAQAAYSEAMIDIDCLRRDSLATALRAAEWATEQGLTATINGHPTEEAKARLAQCDQHIEHSRAESREQMAVTAEEARYGSRPKDVF